MIRRSTFWMKMYSTSLLSLFILSPWVLLVSCKSENDVLSIALCIARCPDVSCRSVCEKSAEKITAIPFTNVTSRSKVMLQCKDERRIVLKHDPGIFSIDCRSEDDEEWQGPIVSKDTICEFSKLIPGKNYKFRLRRVLSDGIALAETSSWFKTSEENYIPKAVVNTTIDRFVPSATDLGQLETYLNITPADDLNCLYHVVHWGPDHNLFSYELDAKSEFRVKLKHLKYDSDNEVHVMSKNKLGERQSRNVTLNFRTPSCLDLHLNLSICPPAPVTGLRFANSSAMNGSVNLEITWNKPELQPDNYTIVVMPLELENSDGIEITVAGNESTASVSNLVAGYRYRVGVIAESTGGTSLKWEVISMPFNSKWEKSSPIIAATTTLTSLLIFLMFAYILHRRKSHFKDRVCRYAFFKTTGRNPLDEVKSPLKSAECKVSELNEYNDKRYEIKAEHLMMRQELGSGIGGIVKLASLRNNQNQSILVAVKMLRENATPDERRDFYREISLMKSTRNHKNIVSLIGCCIFDKQPLLIVEYCSEGDLQTYLRKFFQEIVHVISQRVKCFNGALYQAQHGDCTTNNLLYDIQSEAVGNQLSVDDLLSFAQQVATGMEFLSSNRIIHRDLAARNVLVCADKTVKISDFGLSRDIYQENIYKKQTDGKLPLKWMAIEALTHQIYTTYSDVWSFGVLLYEIVTIGGDPYPGVQSNQVLTLLKTGYRMERPANCGIQIYEIMRSCWHEDPTTRPSFSQLKHRLDALTNPQQNDYLNLSEMLNEPMYYQRFIDEDTFDP